MSIQGPAITHFEVYTLEARGWILHARFRKEEREAALEEAKLAERTIGAVVKVVRETYYPGNNACEETVVYGSDKLLNGEARGPGGASASRRPGGRGNFEPPGIAHTDYATTAAAASRRQPNGVSASSVTRPMGVVVKLLLVIAASLAGAGAVTGVVSAFATRLPSYGVDISEQALSILLFSTFVITFLSAAVPMAMSMIEWEDAAPPPPPKPQPMRAPAPRKPKPRPAKTPDTIPEEPFPSDLEGEDEDLDWSEPIEDSEPLPLEPIPPLPTPEAAPEPSTPAEAAPTAPEPPEADVKPKAKAEEPTAPPAAADGLEPHRMSMMRFLSGLLSEVKKTRPSLDAYNKFGVDLLLAGGIDVLGNQHHLEAIDKRILLKDTIEVMGIKADTAKAFADKYEDYLVEPRYMTMVQVGRNAMEGFLNGADGASDQVGSVFDSWNKPQTTQAAPRIVTVLFTDMVGSTDMTQSRGDVAAQEIVRRHNNIVRAALAEYAGKEVKHTGDGIMASFASAVNGVEAAVSIQKAVSTHNLKNRNLPLHLRIGINAGEPIEEEDDLFGGTVQLAARVCAHADSDEIYCTNVVRELSAGKGLTFITKGAHELKGFKDRVPLYEVMWDALGLSKKAE
ncbi:MAG TPA: adenylate/guanylate cyclase domain-containing protein, partial [Patescibacteria group bacterium]|nr:adenylate/guanylate cyclase domain-containing protein [Patescibacteria group bacterium]